jgi:hypothetical protein
MVIGAWLDLDEGLFAHRVRLGVESSSDSVLEVASSFKCIGLTSVAADAASVRAFGSGASSPQRPGNYSREI